MVKGSSVRETPRQNMSTILHIDELATPRLCPLCGGEIVRITGVGTWCYDLGVMVDIEDVEDSDTAGLDEEELEAFTSVYDLCLNGCGYIQNARQDIMAAWRQMAGTEKRSRPSPRPVRQNIPRRFRLRQLPAYPFPKRYTCFYTHVFLEDLLAFRHSR
ncbi:MAG: hypothetical protein HZC41_22590 [Chloroflexi bacterium]|nr:hypothetical protein [Chloroflexota bacterium]